MVTSTNIEIKEQVVQFRQSTASILVIDSDPGFCIVLEIMLKLYDYGVHRAHDESEAIACIGDQKPDIIVCSLEIITKDEDNLMTYLRSNNTLAKIPIIVIATEAKAINRASLIHNSFIIKPFTAPEIQDLILSHLT